MTDVSSTSITNMTASPRVPVDGRIQGGRLQIACATVTTSASQATTDRILFCRVPSNAVIHSVQYSAASGSSGATNFGVYQTAGNGAAAVDADLFASAVAVSGAKTNLDITFESGVYTYALAQGPLWAALGLSEDPLRDYDIVGTPSTNWGTGPTSVHLKVIYSV